MRGRERLLTLSSLLAVAALVLAALGVSLGWLTLLLGLPLVALLPGHGLTAAILADAPLGRLERFTMAVGVSLVITMLLGFVLAATPLGLERSTWVFGLGGFTLIANTAAVLRLRDREPAEEPEQPMRPPGPVLVALGASASLFLALVVTASAATATRSSSGKDLQLWALPQMGGGGESVRIGVSNNLSPTSLFRLRAFQGELMLAEETLDLPHGASTYVVVRLAQGESRLAAMTVVLDAVSGPPVERTVVIWPRSTGATGTADRAR